MNQRSPATLKYSLTTSPGICTPRLLQTAHFRLDNRSEDMEDIRLVGAGVMPSTEAAGYFIRGDINAGSSRLMTHSLDEWQAVLPF